MKHESDKTAEVVVSDSNETFQSWIHRDYILPETRKLLQEADVLLIPVENFRGLEAPVFPVHTEQVFHFLKKKLPNNKVEICIEDKDYKEVALHSALIIIGSFVASSVVVPMLVTALYDYIKEKVAIGKEKKKVKVSLTVIQKDGTVKNVTYEGDAENFKTIHEELKKLK